MASQSLWYYTGLPNTVIDAIEEDLDRNFSPELKPSVVGHSPDGTGAKTKVNELNTSIRNAQNAWIPSSHWIAGFCWHYVMRANRENFLYDLSHIDQESLQYTVYDPGEYYGWHSDADLSTMHTPLSEWNKGQKSVEEINIDKIRTQNEFCRKLSFSLLIADPSDYRGGNLEIYGFQDKKYIVPKQRGTIILFDSRAKHRVTKVTEGVRKSIVGWTVGPRWK
tara:strand:- start:2573 stop:3238 length:666 start_codon:yes stop_codon:yes gene_type:complete